jgi:hypothetical protein
LLDAMGNRQALMSEPYVCCHAVTDKDLDDDLSSYYTCDGHHNHLHQSRERRGSLSSYSATDEKVVPTGYKYRNRRRHDSSTSGTSDDDYSYYYYDDSDEGTSAETHRPVKGWHLQMQDQIQRGMGLLDSAPWQPRKVERKSLLAKAAPVPMRIKTSSRLPEATTATTTTTTTTPVAANRQKQAIRDEQSSLTPRHTAVLATPQYFSFETQDRYRGKKNQRRARKQANDEADLPISIIPVTCSQPHSEPVPPLVAVPSQLPLSLQTKVEAAELPAPEVVQDLVSGSWTVSASSTVEVMLTTSSTEAAATIENNQDEKNVVPIATPAIGQQESQAEDEEVCIQTLSSAVASQYGEIEVVSDKDDEAVANTASIVEDVPQKDPETAAPMSDSASDATPNNHEQAVEPRYSNVEADTVVSLDSNVSDVIEFNPEDGPSPQISPTGSTSRDLVDIFASDSPVDPDDIVISPCPSSPPESLLPASSTSSSSLRVSSSSLREGGSENSSHVSRKQRSSSRAVQSPTNRRAFRAADV